MASMKPSKTGSGKATLKQAVKPAARSATARGAVTPKPTTKPAKAVARAAAKPAAGKTARAGGASRPAVTPTGANTSARKTPAKSPARKAAGQAPRRITAKQALANTRKLLEAKQAHDREAPPWQALDQTHAPAVRHAGFQSEEAHARADELHAEESRMDAIQGSISTQDRHRQGKRDSR